MRAIPVPTEKSQQPGLHLLSGLREGLSSRQRCFASRLTREDSDTGSVSFFDRQTFKAERLCGSRFAHCLRSFRQCGRNDGTSDDVRTQVARPARPACHATCGRPLRSARSRGCACPTRYCLRYCELAAAETRPRVADGPALHLRSCSGRHRHVGSALALSLRDPLGHVALLRHSDADPGSRWGPAFDSVCDPAYSRTVWRRDASHSFDRSTVGHTVNGTVRGGNLDLIATDGNERHGSLSRFSARFFFSLLLLSGGQLLRADGGKVQLQKQAGPFVITLFSDPSQVRVGRVDLSVLCQKSDDKSTVLD